MYSALRLSPAGKLTQRTSTATHVCATTTDRLFVTDRISKRQFPNDTDCDLCAYPNRLIPRRKEWVNYNLCAASGTTIHTYGWLLLNINLGLRRDFTWRFVVADFTHPLIGVDFLSNIDLAVDCRRNRLLDGVISLFVPA
jgi:hypothetical protein